MTALIQTFIVCNSLLLGAVIAASLFLKDFLKKIQSTHDRTIEIKNETLLVCQKTAEAHNLMAKELIAIQDRVMAVEMRAAHSKALHRTP